MRGRSTDQGTPGRLLREDGSRVAYTLELPWRENRRGRSCIPAGTYRCVYSRRPRHGLCYLVAAVRGRSNILIHSANVAGDVDKGYATELLGCIALGSYIGSKQGQLAVLVSRPAVSAFQREMAGETFTLEVREQWASSTS